MLRAFARTTTTIVATGTTATVRSSGHVYTRAIPAIITSSTTPTTTAAANVVSPFTTNRWSRSGSTTGALFAGAARLPTPPVATSIAAEQGLEVDVFRFDTGGNYEKYRYSLAAMSPDVHARDLMSIDQDRNFRRASPAILPRKDCILVSVSHVKAIIRSDCLYLLDPSRPVVRHFAKNLKEFLQSYSHTHVDESHPGIVSDEGAIPSAPLGPSTPVAETPDDAATPEPVHHTIDPNAGHVADNVAAAASATVTTATADTTTAAASSEAEDESPTPTTQSSTSTTTNTESVFLPPSPETAHVPIPRNQSVHTNIQDTPVPLTPLPSFEFRALEGILSLVSRKYDLRMACFQPVIHALLIDLHAVDSEPSAEMLHRLLPLKNSLSQFERIANELIECIAGVLKSEKAMNAMFLTEKKRRHGRHVSPELHHECELLLENYRKQVVDVRTEAYYLRKKIQSTEELIRIAMDNHRNKILRLNVLMAMASVGISSGTVVLGSFGMNLHSGFEDHPHAFMMAIGSSVGVTCLVYAGLLRWKASRGALKDKVRAIDQVQDLLEGMGDIQDIVMSRFVDDPRAKLIPDEFQSLLKQATGRQITKEQMTLLMRAFDWNKDGFLDRDDVMRFLSAQQGVYSRDPEAFKMDIDEEE